MSCCLFPFLFGGILKKGSATNVPTGDEIASEDSATINKL
jgi:hypothetical protein